MKSYTELSKLDTFEERLNYLSTHQNVGAPTFDSHRYLNQRFYQSSQWKSVRDKVIIRDNGCDMGLQDYPINGRVYIHHINPITEDELIRRDEDKLLNPENLICVSFATHNAIHYGDKSYAEAQNVTERKPNDTIPWR